MEIKSVNDRKAQLEQLLKESKIPVSVFPWFWLQTTDFFTAPASKGHHAAYPGGLFDHSLNVATVLVKLTVTGICSPWGRPESPVIVGLLHDATKFGLYVPETDPTTDRMYKINPNYKALDSVHGADSVAKLKEIMMLTEEEEACIRYHMGAYEVDDWDGYDKAIKAFPNVLWTHTADMYASKLMEVDG